MEKNHFSRKEAQEKVLEMQKCNLRLVEEKIRKRHIHGEYKEILADGKRCRMLYYPGAQKDSPVYFDIHGGGMAWGMIEEGDLLCHRLNEQLGYACYALDYPLQPQHPYPEGLFWLYDMLRYIVSHEEEFPFDRERIAVGGRSAGGYLTAALCILAGRTGEFRINCQAPDHMAVDWTGSIREGKEIYCGEGALSEELLVLLGISYASPEQQREALCSPIFASKEELRKMPPAVIQTCEFDSLRIDGDTYAEMLRREGIPVVHRCAKGALHGFTEDEGPLQEAGIWFIVEGIHLLN